MRIGRASAFHSPFSILHSLFSIPSPPISNLQSPISNLQSPSSKLQSLLSPLYLNTAGSHNEIAGMYVTSNNARHIAP
jgi:hypothetical protein